MLHGPLFREAVVPGLRAPLGLAVLGQQEQEMPLTEGIVQRMMPKGNKVRQMLVKEFLPHPDLTQLIEIVSERVVGGHVEEAGAVKIYQ